MPNILVRNVSVLTDGWLRVLADRKGWSREQYLRWLLERVALQAQRDEQRRQADK